MKVALGKFACSGLEAYFGPDTPAGVRTAIFHYTHRLKAGRRPVALPRFLAGQTSQEPELDFDLEVDPETEALLEREALRQRTTINQQATHTVLTYLAELEFRGVKPTRSVSRP